MDYIVNLHDELLGLLKSHNKTVDDIDWVECRGYDPRKHGYATYHIPTDNFIEVAKKTEYNQEYYCTLQIPSELRIYGKNRAFIIYVYVYDNKENLEYIDFEVNKPAETREIYSLEVYTYDAPVWLDDEKEVESVKNIERLEKEALKNED